MPGLNLSAGGVSSQRHYAIDKSSGDDNYIVVDKSGNSDVQIVEISAGLIQQERAHAGRGQQLAQGLIPVTGATVMPEYQIGPGDVLTVTVWEHPELTNPAGGVSVDPVGAGRLVASDGTIFYPYAGVMHVGGKTALTVREEIRQALRRVITEPQVDVRVSAYRAKRAQVFGDVLSPGVVALDDTPKGVIEAINERGGLTSAASRRNIYLRRDAAVYRIDLTQLLSGDSPGQNPGLQPGDVLQVPDKSADQVFVLGEVEKQQPIYLQQDRMTLTEALTTSGGLDKLRAAGSGILIFRRADVDGQPPKVFTLDISTPVGLLLAGEFELRPRDVVYVKATDFAKYNVIVAQLLPTITGIYQAQRIVENP